MRAVALMAGAAVSCTLTTTIPDLTSGSAVTRPAGDGGSDTGPRDTDGGPSADGSFCKAHPALFCDDFDDARDLAERWNQVTRSGDSGVFVDRGVSQSAPQS